MVLESTMICVDDSDFMRNGDFVPTRMAAVQDAVGVVTQCKTRANPENNVGLLTLASSEVLTTLTTDAGKLMSKLLAVQPSGELKLLSGLRVAHLALKHRQGKNHKMRIVVFVGSPLETVDIGEFTRLAKRLKKEKVNVDIVSFGEDNTKTLQTFVDTLNGKDGNTSHLIIVPPGPTLTEAIVNSPILQSEDGAPIGGGAGYDFGIDPNDDPELALALRVSMEEQRARQEAEARANNPEANAGPSNEEQMLERALAVSLENDGNRPAAASAVPDFNMMTEDEQIAYAMQMSMNDAASAEIKQEVTPEPTNEMLGMEMEMDESSSSNVKKEDEKMETEDMSKVLEDANLLAAVLEDIPSEDAKKPTPAPTTPKTETAPTSSSSKKSPEKDAKKKPDPKSSGKK